MADRGELGALWDIVRRLADGNFHSGEELGGLLGVSRAAVWKHLQKLQHYGVILSSVKGRGYCIDGGLDLLDREKIFSHLYFNNSINLQIFPQLDSTNSFLMRSGNPAGQVCLAEFQSAGRGRRGRSWVSPLGQNIYCSIGWSFDGGVAAIEGLSLAMGVAIVRAIRSAGLIEASLKWPNDVLYHEKKLAGILIEMTGDPAGYCQVVIGVGLNVSMGEMPGDQITQPWASINTELIKLGSEPVSRNTLAATLINELTNVLATYESKGFVEYKAEWMSHAAYKGQEVELLNGASIIHGIFHDITEKGALRLLTNSGEQTVHGGEISLRKVK